MWFSSVIFIPFFLFGNVCCQKEAKTPGVLLCRQCGHTIVNERELVDIKSPQALQYKNASVLGPKGVLVQTLKNPQGILFDVITASKPHIHTVGEAYAEYSWFPGFAWQLATCPRCQAHLGWAFKQSSHEDEDPSEKYKDPHEYSFAGLILSKLIRESFADSLIITPKVYQR